MGPGRNLIGTPEHLGGTGTEGVHGHISLRKVLAPAAGMIELPFPGTWKMAGEVGSRLEGKTPARGLVQISLSRLWWYAKEGVLSVQATHPSGHRRPPPKTLLTWQAHPRPQPCGPLGAGALSPPGLAGPSGSHPHLAHIRVSKGTPEWTEGDMGWEISQGEVQEEPLLSHSRGSPMSQHWQGPQELGAGVGLGRAVPTPRGTRRLGHWGFPHCLSHPVRGSGGYSEDSGGRKWGRGGLTTRLGSWNPLPV